MPTTKECEHNAELCLKLASETKEIYAKIALLELAKEYRARTHMEARSARELN
jgi:predicted negative regulator of RcsB-dependent stress response